jgi:5'-deoxynucleotidase YfbR-like HD superfamily hydrolase
MSEQYIHTIEVINADIHHEKATYPTTASTILELGGLAMKFARVERVPRYADGARETDVEHSFMLALVAPELAHMLYPASLDARLVGNYAVVHDLIEVKTGDVATFQINDAMLQQKEMAEHEALESLLAELPPLTRDLLYNYEQQADPESRFVRAVDKLLPIIVDIIGSGRRVMNEDYQVHTHQQLGAAHDQLKARMQQRFHEFPHIVADHALLCELFEEDFSFAGQ